MFMKILFENIKERELLNKIFYCKRTQWALRQKGELTCQGQVNSLLIDTFYKNAIIRKLILILNQNIFLWQGHFKGTIFLGE